MSKWTDEELAKLEDPDTWDWDTEIPTDPSPNPGARVAVDIDSPDFQRIARCAEEQGEKLSAFFLTAALERVDRLRSQGEAPAQSHRVGPRKR
jgi:hypothetical protein